MIQVRCRDILLCMNENILLIEDDDAVANAIQLNLEGAGYVLHREADGQKALEAFEQKRWDLVLLDLMLPKLDGWDVCRHIRSNKSDVAILMITGRTAEAHCVLGLELGADDYIAKPFSMLELVARMRAVLRRKDLRIAHAQEPLQARFSDFHLDALKRELFHRDVGIPITRREFDLLWFLVSHPKRVFTRAHLIQQVWGMNFDGFEHAVNSQINRLRAKIEVDAEEPKFIVTVWGVGYRFEPTP
jgi:DNA-binding response OmpR family regulator